MKAMAINHFNTEPSAHDLPSPQPGDGEVIVDVECASLKRIHVMTWLRLHRRHNHAAGDPMAIGDLVTPGGAPSPPSSASVRSRWATATSRPPS